jgi:hypothetical protein
MSFWKTTTIILVTAGGIAGIAAFIYMVMLAQEFTH